MSSIMPILVGGDVGPLAEVVIALVAAFVAALISSKTKIPSILAYVFAGLLIGPQVTGLVADHEVVDIIAQIGIVFLLFAIGMKISIKKLMALRHIVFVVGGLQFGITTAIVGAVAMAFGLDFIPALIWGTLFALSSTAVVLNLAENKGLSSGPTGSFALGVLLFQDFIAIFLIVMLPVLADMSSGESSSDPVDLALQVGQAVGMIILLFLVARLILPRLFDLVVSSRSREVFSLAAIVIVLAVAAAAGAVGVSLALGAFVAGLVIADSDFSRQIFADIVPIRDTLTSLFFLSIGMLVAPAALAEDWLLILGISLGVVILKAVVVLGIGLATGYGGRLSVTGALWLAQVGEFSFALGTAAAAEGILNKTEYDILIAVAVISMALTPLLFNIAPKLVSTLHPKLPGPRTSGDKLIKRKQTMRLTKAHVIIVGYGINGQNVARMLKQADIPYVIIEMNPRTVEEVRSQGETVFFGDASRPEILEYAGVDVARALVVTLPDATISEGVVHTARKASPHIHIVARTRYLREIQRLKDLGADSVVPEEFETSLEIASRVMVALGASEWAIAQQRRHIRDEQYATLFGKPDSIPDMGLLFGADLGSLTLSDVCQSCGSTLMQLDTRRKTGASVVAVARDGQLTRNPGGDFKLTAGDTVYLFGSHDEIEAAKVLLDPPPPEEASAQEDSV